MAVGVTPLAGAQPPPSAGCVAQFVSDVLAAGVSNGQLIGSKPNGLAHSEQPLGSGISIQATAPHSDCPFSFP
jgi:hypothetical protein